MWAALKPGYCPKTVPIHQYVCFLLAHHLLADAIRAYQRSGLYLEAILLARLRLPDNHPLIPPLYTALSNAKNISYGVQICCYASIGDIKKSAECALKLADDEPKRRFLKAKLCLRADMLREVIDIVCALWENDEASTVRDLCEENAFREKLDSVRCCFTCCDPVTEIPHADVFDAYPKALAQLALWTARNE